jgi:hypothetical protein
VPISAACASREVSIAADQLSRCQAQDELQQRQTKHRISRCKHIIRHHPEAVLDAVEVAGRGWLDDVEEAEQEEGGGLPEQAFRAEEEHAPEGYDLVPDDAAMVGLAQILAGAVAGEYAADVAGDQQQDEADVVEPRAQQQVGGPCEERADGARRPRRQAAAEAAGEQVRRVRKKKTGGRRG